MWIILISSILRHLPAVLTRTCMSSSATGTPTPWCPLCSADRQRRSWKASSLRPTSPSSRTGVYLTAPVPRSAWGTSPVTLALQIRRVFHICFLLYSLCVQEMVDIKRFIEKRLPPIADEWTREQPLNRTPASESSGLDCVDSRNRWLTWQ